MGNFFIYLGLALIMAVNLNSTSALATINILEEVKGSKASTTRIFVGETIISQIHRTGDNDWFKIQMKANTVYDIKLTGIELEDPMLILRSLDGRFLIEDDDGGADLNSRLIYHSKKDQTLFVVARETKYTSVQSAQAGDRYELSVEKSYMIKKLTRFKDAAHIGVGTSASKVLRSLESRHIYQVYLRANQTYQIDLLGSGTGTINNPIADTLLSVHNSNKKKIAEDDDGGRNLDSSLQIRPTQTGIYYLVVKRALDQVYEGRYRINIEKK